MQANATKHAPEQLWKALKAAQAEVEELKKQLEQAQSAEASPKTSRATGRKRMSPVQRWALVGALQLSGLVAYFVAADRLACLG